MAEPTKQLIPALETYLLLLADQHPELLDREEFLKEAETMGVNGEILYNNIIKVCRRYTETFSKGRERAEDESFYFETLDFSYLILGFWVQCMEEPQLWKGRSEDELRRFILMNLDNSEPDLPQEIDTEAMLAVVSQLVTTDDVKWKMMIFLQEPRKHIKRLFQLKDQNLLQQEKAREKIAVPLRKALLEFEKLDFSRLGDSVSVVREADVEDVYPVLAAPYMDLYVSLGSGGIKRYMGVYCADFYKMMKNKKKPGDYLQPVLKALGDKSKFEIIMSLKASPKYNLEIADQLGLTPATMSHHMSMLLTCGLVQIEKRDGRVYYYLDKQRIKEFMEQLEHVLL